MLDSERTFKIKVRLRGTVFVNVSNYLYLKSFAWKRDCSIYSKLQTSRNLIKVIQESSYRSLAKCANIHINRATHYEIMAP